MTEAATFVCSICNDPSTDICVFCTKDTCYNHRCNRCRKCSDCCECDVPLTSPEPIRVSVPLPAPPEVSVEILDGIERPPEGI